MREYLKHMLQIIIYCKNGLNTRNTYDIVLKKEKDIAQTKTQNNLLYRNTLEIIRHSH